jgi:sugar phosphate isomerase/epimerase
MNVLLDSAPNVHWEIDIAWIVRADADPLPWVEQYLDRISAVHMKDLAPAGECADEDGWADVGYGVIDWASLLPGLQQTPARLYAMEHDNPSDLQRFARRSIERANTWQLPGA